MGKYSEPGRARVRHEIVAKSGEARILKKPAARQLRLTRHGQHGPAGVGCISTSIDGEPCQRPRETRGVPYCMACMTSGDPSLRVVEHPKYGKILVAARPLPKPYYIGWWGKLIRPKSLPPTRWEWALQTEKGMIDAIDHPGSLLQFCACPGPHEVPVVDFAPNDEALLEKGATMGCSIFRTTQDIPMNHQVTMMYNQDEKTTDEFFKERGLVRDDVGLAAFPAVRKKRAGLAPWEIHAQLGGA